MSINGTCEDEGGIASGVSEGKKLQEGSMGICSRTHILREVEVNGAGHLDLVCAGIWT